MTEPAAEHNDEGQLAQFVERMKDAERDKRHHAELLKEIAAEAKAIGHNPKLLRRRVKDELMSEADKAKRDREEDEYEAICRTLGAF